MINWKKVKNFLRVSLTVKEITSLMKVHMVQVCCGRSCETFNLEEMKLVETDHGREMVIIYPWAHLFWEVSLDRKVAAYAPDVAELRYQGEMFDFSELVCSEETYKCWMLSDGMAVRIWGKTPETLHFRKVKDL